MAPEELLLVGRVGTTHGVRGEVKVMPETEDPSRFTELDTVFVGQAPEQATARRVESVRFQQGRRGVTVVLKLAGFDTPEAAATLRRQAVFARAADLPPPDDDEFFLHDLIGARVVTDAGEEVGTLKDILELSAHAVYVVSRPGKPEAMIPAVPVFIAEVDLERKTLVVHPIEGLL